MIAAQGAELMPKKATITMQRLIGPIRRVDTLATGAFTKPSNQYFYIFFSQKLIAGYLAD